MVYIVSVYRWDPMVYFVTMYRWDPMVYNVTVYRWDPMVYIVPVSYIKMGDRGSTVVKVLCYKSGRWFDPS